MTQIVHGIFIDAGFALGRGTDSEPEPVSCPGKISFARRGVGQVGGEGGVEERAAGVDAVVGGGGGGTVLEGVFGGAGGAGGAGRSRDGGPGDGDGGVVGVEEEDAGAHGDWKLWRWTLWYDTR